MTEMSPAEAVFFAAAALPAAERAAYLAQACAGRDDLRLRVEQMLAAQPLVGSFLEPPAEAGDATSTHAPGRLPEAEDYREPTARVGALLAGKYKLVEEIGAGGMGTVFMAQQTEPIRRAVAIKVIKAGMDSKAVLARFEAERQALAMMDHPNIARVLDAGTTDSGRPFFVMELVKGTPITRYCDEHRLTPLQRLELFVPVCQAIQHAHQKGIIHRDIKPSNVLVALYDDRPVPKVIDFGVAKAAGQALTDKTLMTGFGALVGTPEYMSPEQASLNNLDIDTRSDVYSLGVLLYELLTGTTPVDKGSLGNAALLEVLRIVREVEAPRPSAKLSTIHTLPHVAANRGIEPTKLSRLMKGELDWLVMKALEKDRTRRYETANALSRDIQRYLADEVVEARPPSVGYRIKKFVRRHKGQVIAASLVLVVLVGGIIGTSIGLVQADRARDGEKAEREKAEGLAERNAKLADDERDAKNKATELASTNAKLADDESKARNAAEHQLGVSNLLLASAAYDNGDVKLAAERLDKVSKEQRGWEWHHLKQQVRGGIFTLVGHKNIVTSVAFSPDGTRIVTGGGGPSGFRDMGVVWDARTGAELLDLKGHTEFVTSVAFSPDGTQIATGSMDRTVKVWDARSGTPRLELQGPVANVSSLSVGPDGSRIATAGEDKSTGRLVHTVKVWDARAGTEQLTLRGHEVPVRSMCFSPDGTRILTGGGADEGSGGKKPGELKVWDARTGAALLDLKGLKEGVYRVAFSPDGTRIISGGSFYDDGKEELKVWDARTGRPLLDLTQPGAGGLTIGDGPAPGASVAYSPDGTRFVVVGHGLGSEVKVCDAQTGALLVQLNAQMIPVRCVAFSPDGTRIAVGSGDRTARVFDARTGKLLAELKGHTGAVNSVAFSPDRDGTRLVTGSEDRTVRVWDVRTGTALIELKGHTGLVTSASFTPDGTRIVSAGFGERGKPGNVFVWYARVPTPLELRGHTGPVTSVSFSSNSSRVATASGDGTAKLWDTRTGALLHNLGGVRSNVQQAVAFSPDGTRLVTPRDQNYATVWDAQTGTAVFDLKARPGFDVHRVSFTPDGTRIVTRSGAGDKALVWDARTGKEVLNEPIPVTHEPGLTSPDGRWFARVVGNGVELVSLKPDPEELEYRLLHTRPNPRRYREAYLAARAAKDDFAAAFYLNPVPPADRKAVLAQADAETFAALSKRGEEYMVARRWDDAVPLLIEILNVNRAKLGPEDPATIQSMDNLGRTYHQMGQYAKAIPLLEDVWKARKPKEGPASPQSRYGMQLLIESCRLAGEHAKIVNILVEQLPADRKSMPADSPELADVLARLGGAYLGQKKWAEAEPLLRECVTILEKSQPDYWKTFDAQSMLGGALSGQKNYAIAEPLLLKGYEGLKARERTIPLRENTRILEALDRLIELHTATDKPDEVKKWRAERTKYPEAKNAAAPQKK